MVVTNYLLSVVILQVGCQIFPGFGWWSIIFEPWSLVPLGFAKCLEFLAPDSSRFFCPSWGDTVHGSEIPFPTTWDGAKTRGKWWEIHYQPQQVFSPDFWLNHQHVQIHRYPPSETRWMFRIHQVGIIYPILEDIWPNIYIYGSASLGTPPPPPPHGYGSV